MTSLIVKMGRIAVVLGGMLLPLTASAEPDWRDVRFSADLKTHRVAGPIYNPESKSYVELHHAVYAGHGTQGPNWTEAQRLAKATSYKGVQGRLVLVKDYEMHSFLLRNFRGFREAWIGMRVQCDTVRAYWEDGMPVDEQQFNAWDLQSWHRSDVNCNDMNLNWMSVYYKPLKENFRWQASGSAKRFEFFFVEYPTGEP